MKPGRLLLFSIGIAIWLVSAIHAESIAIVDTTLTIADPTQLGRTLRNGIPQDWLGTEQFPGTINPNTLFNYKTFTYGSSIFVDSPYVEITTYEPNDGTNYFFSAYFRMYDPLIPANYWLGDIGSNIFPLGDGGDMQIIVPQGFDLVLVLNSNTAEFNGLGTPFHFTVDAYTDNSYDDPVDAPTVPPTIFVTPEPSTFFTFGTGLLAFATLVRSKLGSRLPKTHNTEEQSVHS